MDQWLIEGGEGGGGRGLEMNAPLLSKKFFIFMQLMCG